VELFTEVLFFDGEGAENGRVQHLVVAWNVCTRQPVGKCIFVSSNRTDIVSFHEFDRRWPSEWIGMHFLYLDALFTTANGANLESIHLVTSLLTVGRGP
jgi:hypothetical protein